MLNKEFSIIFKQTKNEMNTFFTKLNLLAIGCLFLASSAMAQTNQQRAKITNQYNKQVLSELEQTFSTKAKKEKKKLLKWLSKKAGKLK